MLVFVAAAAVGAVAVIAFVAALVVVVVVLVFAVVVALVWVLASAGTIVGQGDPRYRRTSSPSYRCLPAAGREKSRRR